MGTYILKRIVGSVLILLLIMVVTFLLMNAIPGSPFLTEKSTPEQIAMAEAKYGLDKPLHIQLLNYIKNYLKGDLGTSLKMQEGTPVKNIIFHQGKFVLSIKLGLFALLLAVGLGIPLGCLAAYYRGSWLDGVLRVVTTIGVAIPTFVLAALLLVVFSVKLKWVPTLSGSLTDAKSYILPVISLSSYYTCYIAKLMRTSMLDAINQDYIRTARANGLSEGSVVYKHALKNALIPVITIVGMQVRVVIGGSLLVEQLFNIPGLGTLLTTALNNRDYMIVQTCTLLISLFTVGANLLVDIAYGIVDPRIRKQRR